MTGALYVETSALLRMLLGGPFGPDIQAAIDNAAAASNLHCSRLTIAEARRNLQRYKNTGHLTASRANKVLREVRRFRDSAELYDVTRKALQRAGQPFLAEPVYALDALHVATALELEAAAGSVVVASTDKELRRNAVAYGLAVVPSVSAMPL